MTVVQADTTRPGNICAASTLPNVLVQDPARGCAYCIPADDLIGFEATVETWARLDDSTVTFVILDGGLVDEIPPSLRTPELSPSALIRYVRARKAYLLTHQDLQRFRVAQPTEPFDPGFDQLHPVARHRVGGGAAADSPDAAVEYRVTGTRTVPAEGTGMMKLLVARGLGDIRARIALD